MGIDIIDLPLYTATTIDKCSINSIAKIILLHSVHWPEGQKGYREFIRKANDTINQYPGYLFLVNGYCSYKGAIILECIKKHLLKNKNVEKIKLSFGPYHATYSLNIKVKDN